MKRLAGLLLVVLSIVACAVGLYVSAANRGFVTVDLLFWPDLQVRTGLLVVGAFVLGALAGLLAGAFTALGRSLAERGRR